MTSIFLSYARGDDGEPFDPARSFVARLQRDLESLKFNVWFDRVRMPSRRLTFHQEIRDAVADCDRLLLVVGPKAVVSDYVRQEWQFAYFQADKIVTPILRAGDFRFVPDELKLLHCEDFRDDAQYEFHLEQLARILRDPIPQLGELIGVPSLPAHFLSRTNRLVVLRDALRADLDRPVVISGAAARVGLHGMGGIGKSILASALAHDRKIREAFPDGIVWIGLGPLPDVAALQRRVHHDLGGDGAIANVHDGQMKLKDLLADKAVLLVIDDVWRRPDVDAFNVLGPRCRAMITTRDAGLLTSLGGTHHVVELLTDDEAMNVLAQSSGVARDALPSEAQEIIGECGRLPLAVSLAGGMIQAGTPWRDVLDALREHELEFLEDEHAAVEQHRNLWKMIEVSVQVLPAEEQKRLAELAVFSTDEAIPEAAVTTLWESTGGLSSRHAQHLLVKLKQRSLVQLTPSAETARESVGTVSLHDLIHDFCVRLARREVGDERTLHGQLLDAYRAKCANGWPTGPDDGYFFTHLRDHLVEAGSGTELADLLLDLHWLEAKNGLGLIFDAGHDFSASQKTLAVDDARRRSLGLLDEALRRDMHFIDRHHEDYPQGLFQCLWNSCWWYDCSEAAAHYVEPEGGWSERPPWESTQGRLCDLLARWRAAKDGVWATRLWIRTLRPPAVHLGAGQQSVLRGHESWVLSVTFCFDGRRIASGSNDKTVRVWDTETGAEIRLLRGHTEKVTSVAFSPDGRRIASGSNDNTVRVWDTETGAEFRVLRGHEYAVTSIAFSPDGRRIASGSNDNTVRVWDTETGAEIRQLSGHTWIVASVSFSRDGRWIASGGGTQDRTVRVWDAQTGDQLHVLRGHGDGVTSVSFSRDGRRIASGSGDFVSPRDCTVRLWDAETGAELRVLRGHESAVTSVAFSPDGRRIATGSNDYTIRVWDAATGSELRLLRGHESCVKSVSFSPDGRRIATGSLDKTVRMWDVETGTELRMLRGHAYNVTSVAVAADGRRIATGSADRTLRLWDAQTAAEVRQLRGHEGRVLSLAFSPDDRRIATGSDDHTIRVWDARTGAELQTLRGDQDVIWCLCFSPDGRRIASGSNDYKNYTLCVRSAEMGSELRLWRAHEDSISSVAFSPDGRWIASGAGTYDPTIRVWDAQSGEQLHVLRGHAEYVESIAFSLDGRRIVSSSGDNTVRVWDAETGESLRVIKGIADAATIAVAMEMGAHCALGRDGETVIENFTTGQIVARFPDELRSLASQPGSRLWAGRIAAHLQVLRLEDPSAAVSSDCG
jgi:WD40 repeat protein